MRDFPLAYSIVTFKDAEQVSVAVCGVWWCVVVCGGCWLVESGIVSE